MNHLADISAFTALGHPGRMAVFRLLARRAPQAVQPSEIADALGMKRNTLSMHVKALAKAGLVASERLGREVFYRVDFEGTGALVDYLVADCCRGRPDLCEPLAARTQSRLDERGTTMSDRIFNVLFICTGNSARSIFAEALLRKEGAGKFRAFSAGTAPSGGPNPHAIDVLEKFGHDVTDLRSTSIEEFQAEDAPKMDFVFTVCDRAANEECPPWAGQPLSAHWGMPDPVKAQGNEAEKGLAFLDTYRTLRRRLTGFLALPIEQLDRISLQRELDAIGQQEMA